MKTWQTTNFIEQQEIKAAAEKFFSAHKNHVAEISKDTEHVVAPSGSDLFRPELWKGIHWLWYFKTFDVPAPKVKKPSIWSKIAAKFLPLSEG